METPTVAFDDLSDEDKVRLLKECIEMTRRQLYYLLTDLAKLSPQEWEFAHTNPPGSRRVEVRCFIGEAT
jgi:hypothetical protein